MSFGRVLNIVRNYAQVEPCAINLAHIVTVNQKGNFLFFHTVANREISVGFSDEDTAKKELFDIVETLNRYLNELKK